MAAQSVGIREFRDNLAMYLLEAEGPVTITRHGATVGYFIPARRKRLTEEEWAALGEAKRELQEAMAAAGVSEDEIVEDFKQLRRSRRNGR